MLYHSSLSTKILFVLFVNAKWEDTSHELQVHHIFKGGENQPYFLACTFEIHSGVSVLKIHQGLN